MDIETPLRKIQLSKRSSAEGWVELSLLANILENVAF